MEIQRHVTFELREEAVYTELRHPVQVEALVTIDIGDAFSPPQEEVEDIYLTVNGVDVDLNERAFCTDKIKEQAIAQALEDTAEDAVDAHVEALESASADLVDLYLAGVAARDCYGL